MAFGNRTSTTCAMGSSFSLPPSATTTTVVDWLFRSAPSRASSDHVLLLQRAELRLERLHLGSLR